MVKDVRYRVSFVAKDVRNPVTSAPVSELWRKTPAPHAPPALLSKSPYVAVQVKHAGHRRRRDFP